MGGVRVGLDNPVLAGRVRGYDRKAAYVRRSAPPVRPRLISDVRPGLSSSPAKSLPVEAVPVVAATEPQLRRSTHRTLPTSDHPREVARSSSLVQPVSLRSSGQGARLTSIIAPLSNAPRSKHRTGVQHKVIRRLRLRHVPLANFILTAAAVIVIGLGLAIGFTGLRANRQVAVQAQRLEKASDGTTQASAVPSETKPANVGSYRVAPTLPRFLIIPKLGVDARVLRLGVTANNALGTPPDIFDAGWYDESSEPGQPGATLIDGHVSGPTQRGVFYGLKTLVPGDAIQLERGDGTIFTYKVVTSKVYPANNVDMAAALTPIVPGKPGLNLITCTGQLDATKTHFEQRIMVFAALQ